MRVSSRGSALGAVFFGVLAVSMATPQYIIEDMGAVTGWNLSSGNAIASNGLGGGSSSDGTVSRATRWDPVNGMKGVDTLGGKTAFGFGVNASNTLVGYSRIDPNTFTNHAFRALNGNPVQDLGTLGGDFSEAHGINDKGVIVGNASHSNNASSRAFVWKDGVGMVDIGTLNGSGNSNAQGINAGGQVTGSANASGNLKHAFRYTEGLGMVDLGTIQSSEDLEGRGISGTGDVVGRYVVNGTTFRAFYYKDGGGLTQLNGLIDFDTRAFGVNDSGIAIGTSAIDSNGHYKAVVWNGGTVMDLNPLIDKAGWNLQSANGINDAGQIVGTGIIEGVAHGYRLTPVPEPASMLALGLGFGVLLKRRRK